MQKYSGGIEPSEKAVMTHEKQKTIIKVSENTGTVYPCCRGSCNDEYAEKDADGFVTKML